MGKRYTKEEISQIQSLNKEGFTDREIADKLGRTENSILKSVILSFVALGIVLILVQVAASRTSDSLYVFLIGAMLNVPRFIFVGLAIGYLYKRLYRTEVAKK